MVKRPTWILLVILALVVGAYFLIKKYPLKATQPTPTVSTATYLITQADGVLQSIRIVDNKGDAFQMQRDLSKTWVITAPTSSVKSCCTWSPTRSSRLSRTAFLNPGAETVSR